MENSGPASVKRTRCCIFPITFFKAFTSCWTGRGAMCFVWVQDSTLRAGEAGGVPVCRAFERENLCWPAVLICCPWWLLLIVLSFLLLLFLVFSLPRSVFRRRNTPCQTRMTVKAGEDWNDGDPCICLLLPSAAVRRGVAVQHTVDSVTVLCVNVRLYASHVSPVQPGVISDTVLAKQRPEVKHGLWSIRFYSANFQIVSAVFTRPPWRARR